MKKAIVLVYSGGLDTSVCIPLLREQYGYERIVTVTVDVGQSSDSLREASDKAKELGTEHFEIDAKAEFVREFCFTALRANGDYEGYPLSTALSRPLISLRAVDVAKKLGITDFAHGCTGKGNDQFRIEYGIRVFMPQAEIVAPIRSQNLTRQWEIEYAKKNKIPVGQSLEKIWSIDENIWGRSIEGGDLENPGSVPPENIYAWTKGESTCLQSPLNLRIEFEKGLPVAVNGKHLAPVELVSQVNETAGACGVGRIDIMEDRILGLKVRENYECPGAQTLLTAHRALEALVLTRDEQRFKKLVDSEWAWLSYQGLWWDPCKEALESFIMKTQERVTGEVRLNLWGGKPQVVGRKSDWALYSRDLASFESQSYDQRESGGSVKQFGLQQRMYYELRKDALKAHAE